MRIQPKAVTRSQSRCSNSHPDGGGGGSVCRPLRRPLTGLYPCREVPGPGGVHGAARPAAAVAFLAEDTAVVNGSRVPFVRDAEGRVQWVSAGLRLVPRVDAVA